MMFMPDFDPFGGNTNYSKPKKSFNISESQKKTITTLLVIIIVVGIVYFIATKTIFNNTEIKVNIENTEGEILDAGQISFRKAGKQETQTFSISETIKIKQGTYGFAIMMPGYKPFRAENRTFNEKNHMITETVEKNTPVTIEGFNFLGDDFFLGQKVEAEITLKNGSPSESYYLDLINFSGDAKDWEFYFVHSLTGEIIDSSTVAISPSTQQKYFLVFEIPVDESKGKKTITPKIKYLFADNSFKKEINILEKPEITVSCRNLVETYVFGEDTKNITCEVDNSKNDVTLTDLEISLEIQAEDSRNENIETWFRVPQQQTISSKKKETKIIELNVPSNNVYPGKITGKVIFKSRYFTEDKSFDLELTFNVPTISFETNLPDNKISIDYYKMSSSSENKLAYLRLDNKNNFRINVVDVEIISAGLIDDCNNLIYFNKDSAIGNIQSKTEKPVSLTISVLDSVLLDTQQTNTRPCTIKTTIENPFIDGEFLEYLQILEITTNIVEPEEE
jgi:hypothetical protein